MQLIGRGVIGVEAETGKFLWGYNAVANNVANITAPVVRGDYVFATTAYNTGSALLKISREGDAFRAEWLALPAQLYLADREPTRGPTVVEVRVGDQTVVVEARDGAVRTHLGAAPDPDAVITGKPDVAMALLLGRIDLPSARARGLKLEGDARALKRFKPI